MISKAYLCTKLTFTAEGSNIIVYSLSACQGLGDRAPFFLSATRLEALQHVLSLLVTGKGQGERSDSIKVGDQVGRQAPGESRGCPGQMEVTW